MLKKCSLILLTLAVALSFSSVATAGDMPAQTAQSSSSGSSSSSSGSPIADWITTDTESLDQRWKVGVTCSAVFPKEDDVFNTGINVEGSLSYDIYKFLAVGGEIGYTHMSLDGEPDGDFNAMPLMFDAIVKFPFEIEDFDIVLYCVNGFGVLYSWVDVDSDVFDVDTNTSFLYKLGGGIDFYLTDMIAITFETGYYWNDTDFTLKVNGNPVATAEDIDTNAFYLGGGAKIRF